ncbi:MAG: YceI family protein [Chloroflexi bacterium]|nr:YceI family protein [Chloroflexota bacterium]
MSWQVDYAHTSVHFSVRHMMISTVRGEFGKLTIDAQLDENEIAKIHDANFLTEDDILNSRLVVKIDAASINTRAADRDNHLRSPDFLDVAQYPEIVFKMKRGEKIDAHHGKLIGDLTIRNVTQAVALDVEFVGEAKTPWSHNAGFNAHTKISRKDWGLNWNVALETGGWAVGDEVNIDIEIEFTKVPETAPQAEAAVAA